MNAFYEHHKNNIRFVYRCFDRILLHAVIQPFQQEQRAVGFFWTNRQIYPVSRQVLRDIATQYHNWVKNRSQKWGVPIQEDPPGRRDDFVARYFRRAQPDQVVAIIKAREPATIMTAILGKGVAEPGEIVDDETLHLFLRIVDAVAVPGHVIKRRRDQSHVVYDSA
jgi:hypothetical protein